VSPTVDSLENPEIKRRAGADWSTMTQEISSLPDFDDCFAKVARLFRSLPWD
jgi:hypothetical protein